MRHRHSATDEPLKLIGIVATAAAIGATVAMLFTPRSGSQVRGGLRRRAPTLKNDIRERSVKTVDEADDVADEAKERVQATAAKVAEDAKTTAQKVSNDTKATADQAKTTAKQATKPRAPRS